MLTKLNTKRGGFTLVEIMIVVAIIALLAAIAVPSFMRARKRSQATTLLEELRMIDAAKDQYAIENNKAGSVSPRATDLRAYVKDGSPLYKKISAESGLSYTSDILDTGVSLNNIDTPPTVGYNSMTSNFGEALGADSTAQIKFFNGYVPSPTAGP